jgi:hypothetical protein
MTLRGIDCSQESCWGAGTSCEAVTDICDFPSPCRRLSRDSNPEVILFSSIWGEISHLAGTLSSSRTYDIDDWTGIWIIDGVWPLQRQAFG